MPRQITIRVYRSIAICCLLSFLTLHSIARADGASAISPIGSFGDFKVEGEDMQCEGEIVDLWKDKDAIRGMLHACDGAVDTKQSGIITDQHYEQVTGAVDFTVRLSLGADLLDGKSVPAKNVWVFRGRLQGKLLSGVLTMTNENYPAEKPETKRLSLRLQKKSLPSFANSEEWKKWAAETVSPEPQRQ